MVPDRSFAWTLVSILFVVVGGGCAGAGPDEPDPPSSGGALVPLDAELGQGWRGVVDEATGRPTFVDGRPPSGPPDLDDARVLAAAPARASAFLAAHPQLFGAAAGGGAVARDVAVDAWGARVRFAVTVGGLPLDGGDLVVVVGRDGTVRAASGAAPPAGELPPAPRIEPGRAAEVARNAAAAAAAGPVEVEDAALVATALDGQPVRAAWRVTVVAPELRRDVFVDAATGAVFHERDGFEAVAARGSGIDVHGRRRALDISALRDGYQLRDETRRIATMAGLGARAPLASDDPARWDEGVFGAGAAVDAHANAGQVLDYLAATFGRHGLDGKDGAVAVVVHAGDHLANAYWDGRRAVFGDGDGTRFRPLSGGLDVVAHELFHAVTQAESGLVYEGQPGALNESLSDVFGCLVEQSGAGGDWTVGERVAERPLRDLSDPARTRNPAHMKAYVRMRDTPDEDMGGVHVNSTIPSHAAYLLAAGGPGPLGDVTVPGIGVAAMRDIWWRAATVYLAPRARFADFAEATVVAAEDLHGAGSAEVAAVEAAWRAVGIRPATRPR